MDPLRLGVRLLFAGWLVAALCDCKVTTSEDEGTPEDAGGCITTPDYVGRGLIDGPDCEAKLALAINSCDSRDDDGLCRDYPTNSGGCLGTWTQSQLCDRTEELGFCIQIGSSIDKDDWWLQHFYPKAGTDDCEATQKAAQLCTISSARTWCNTKFPQP